MIATVKVVKNRSPETKDVTILTFRATLKLQT